MSTANLIKMNETHGELIQLVSFKLAGEEYAVEVQKVREIMRMSSVTPVPNTPSDLEGIINLRGQVVPIISLRKKFGMLPGEADHNTRIVVMEIAGTLTGILVDSVSEVIRIAGSEIQPPPPVMAGAMRMDPEVIQGVIHRSDQLLLLLQLDVILSDEEQKVLSTIAR